MRICFLLVALCSSPLHAEIVDRIVAVADGRVITWSGVLAEANYQAFRAATEPVVALEGDALQRIVSKMIDQYLLEEEKEHSPFSPAKEDAKETLEEIRKRFSDAGAYQAALGRFGFSEAELLRRLSRESVIWEFVDYQLRPQVRVDTGLIETYYRETLLPQLGEESQVGKPPLADVSGRIEQILTEREINRLLDEWLQQLRSHAKIKIMSSS